MKIIVFLNELGLGGSEKAACHWALSLHQRGHEIHVVALQDGPRREYLNHHGIDVQIATPQAAAIARILQELRPDVIHAHAPGSPHKGDVLGQALAVLPGIPVVQTNIFGRLDNPPENLWTNFRLFISWTSCAQAARRSFRPLDADFFRRSSVAVYPLEAADGPPPHEVANFRKSHGVQDDEILLGRLSRPEPNKWTDLPIDAFRVAARHHPRLKLLLREPPPSVARALEQSQDRERFLVLPATGDATELARTMASLDVVLHASIVGESFGYGIAEPMNYGKPIIANSTPWQDQAQIELVRHGECGFITSTPGTMADAILKLASNPQLRAQLGRAGQLHIRRLADPVESTDRVEDALRAAVAGTENSHAAQDIVQAEAAANYLDRQQFGHSWREQMALRPLYYRVRFHEWRHARRARLG